MNQTLPTDPYARIVFLRRCLASAYEQGDAPLIRRLSQAIDDIQLLRWEERLTANAS